MKWNIKINENGTVFLPHDLIIILIKLSRIRSKKRRLLKKAVKKQFHKIIYSYLQHEQIKKSQ